MTYKGQISEFKVLGFVISLAVCLVFAVVVYSRFSYVTVPPEQTTALLTEAKRRLSDLDGKTDELNKRLLGLQDQFDEFRVKHSQRDCKQ
jgi:hypothetical protein